MFRKVGVAFSGKSNKREDRGARALDQRLNEDGKFDSQSHRSKHTQRHQQYQKERAQRIHEQNMTHRPESWHVKSAEEKGALETKHFHGQRLFSHYHHHSSPPLIKTVSSDQEEEKGMESTKSEKSEITMVTASPTKRLEKTKIPLMRFTKNGQEVVPNTENAAILTDLSERVTDLEYEGGHSFFKSLRLLLEVYYFSLFLWCQFLCGCACRVIKYQLLALFHLKKVAVIVIRFLTRLLLSGIHVLLSGSRHGVVG